MNELKNLQATGLTTLGAALKSAFDLLNVNRMQTGIDMYGQGRYPFYLEPAVIVAITDGGKLTLNGGIQEEVCYTWSVVVAITLLIILNMFIAKSSDEHKYSWI